ncbi:hypothetical protein [Natronoglycomyces albus]|uniref:Uncharacterized protein n=1 Tax=Natronoglycomyces albus TaxID=2811108 RepID=A0A895XGI3_9ACTN|nr:hypothetical protein [Natronoglycomyces albus]QSB04454.1 hypothetical protein JQS30_11750 [Natronoglycomyces albus]
MQAETSARGPIRERLRWTNLEGMDLINYVGLLTAGVATVVFVVSGVLLPFFNDAPLTKKPKSAISAHTPSKEL